MQPLLKNLCSLGVTVMSLLGCASSPKGAIPVSNFDADKYLGNWYEIARFDFKYERNMSNVTANYSLNKDGSIKILNKGFDYVKGEWKEAEGKALFRSDRTQGALKVSFFGPFYGSYNVISIDSSYKYALVMGRSTDYLWILSRDKTIPDDVKAKYLLLAKSLNYDLSRLVWTKQE